MQPLELTNGNLLDNETYSNIRILGIGKPTANQLAKQETRITNRIEKKEAKGKDTTKLVNKLTTVQQKAGGATNVRTTLVPSGVPNPAVTEQSLEDVNAGLEETATEESASTTDSTGSTTGSGTKKKTGKGASANKAGTSDGEVIEEEKFLGMPKPVGITVLVVGSLAVLIGGFFLVRKVVS